MAGSSDDTPVRAILKLTYRCNSHCLFCRVDPHRAGGIPDVPAPDVVRRMAAARDPGVGMVLFSGGEPTLRDDLPTLARAATSLGLRWGLITNGRRLAYAPYRDAMVALGLAYVHTSLHGSCAATHDALVQCAGFDHVIAALDGLAGRGIELHVNTVLNRTNLHEIADIAGLLAFRAPITHKLCLAEPRGLFDEHADLLLVPPEEAAIAAVAEVRRSRDAATGVTTVVLGFPACQVEAASDAVSGLRGHNILWMAEAFEDDLYPTDDGARTFPAACEGCTLRQTCPGVWSGYADRYGDVGLKPRH
ncbi:MAG: radical SAM protein [Deltaproteobacteria bacterium]|nr:radical SAM protein [Deltaproteobacteria bacterium]